MNLGIHLILNPAGTYSFVGSVPVKLCRLAKDGSMLTDRQAVEVVRSNMPALCSKCRVFTSVSDALEAAKALGIEPNNISIGVNNA